MFKMLFDALSLLMTAREAASIARRRRPELVKQYLAG